jgi:hypothetical protein
LSRPLVCFRHARRSLALSQVSRLSAWATALSSRFPVAFRRAGLRLLGHHLPAEAFGPPYGRLTGRQAAGPRQGYHVPRERELTGVGALSTAGARCLAHPDASQDVRAGMGPCFVAPLSPRQPLRRPAMTQPQQGLTCVHPSGFPLARSLPSAGSSLGLQPLLHTLRQECRRNACEAQGQAQTLAWGPKPHSLTRPRVALAGLSQG